MARSTLAVIAALELTPLPQTIRGNYLFIKTFVCVPKKPRMKAIPACRPAGLLRAETMSRMTLSALPKVRL